MREKYGSNTMACDELKKEVQGTEAWQISSAWCESSKSDSHPVYLVGHEKETEDFYVNTSVKAQTIIVWSILLNYAGTVLAFSLGWFIFWESIVYRALLYIIYGKKKTKNEHHP